MKHEIVWTLLVTFGGSSSAELGRAPSETLFTGKALAYAGEIRRTQDL